MLDMNDEYTQLAEETLSEKRFFHSRCVAKCCVDLAGRYGEDKIAAYAAGILHDIRKESLPAVLLEEVKVSDLSPDPVELAEPKLWHAIAGAHFAKEVLGVDDDYVINAIRYHTIGRPDMSNLEKITYLGDLTAEDRNYPDVEHFREVADSNLDRAMFEAIKWQVADVMQKKGRIPKSTYQAYAFYKKAAEAAV